MENSKTTSIEHIIAKIDNDFNPDNSDWIPRVGVWCIEAMHQLKVLRTVKKERCLAVVNRIAKYPCCDKADIKVYDSNGCEIVQASSNQSCCDSFTGGQEQSVAESTATIDYGVYNPNAENTRAVVVNEDYHDPLKETIYERKQYSSNRNYVIQGNNIELNFDTDKIKIVTDEIETTHSDYYNMDVPVIPNNGILIEALTAYCMFKMLTRDYKHPVLNLTSASKATNPYNAWSELSIMAKRSVIIDAQGDMSNAYETYRSSMYNNAFNPRR